MSGVPVPKRPARILVVEDNAILRAGIAVALGEIWGPVEEASTGDAAVKRLSDPAIEPFDLVVTDLRLPGADGLEVLKAARAHAPSTRVLLMTAYGSVETAVDAMRIGAADFIQKPFDLTQLEFRVARALGALEEQGEPNARRPEPRAPEVGLPTESPAMREAVEMAARVAPVPSTVLITGETGTGKELIAALIHRLSQRREKAFVKVNCAALPEPLLESELFGHERGAFTGAERQRRGRFEEASGGTLFLDEVGDMPPATQVKLLRVLQDQEFYRLGGTQALRTDARIVAATNVDLEVATRERVFREDLYFRLNVVGIHLPPLRGRPEDAVALAQHFLEEISVALGRGSAAGFTEAALERIRSHPWPGNVRELRNAIERSVLMSNGGRLKAEELAIGRSGTSRASGAWEFELPAGGVDLHTVERDLVLAALERSGYIQKDAARLLRVTPRKLNYMIQRLGVTHPSWRRNRRPEASDRDPARGSNGSGSRGNS